MAALCAALCAAAVAAGGLTSGSTSSSDPAIVRQFSDLGGKPYTVGYNKRSMLVGGKPVLLLSGSIHYVRSTPEMWPGIFAKMKASGLNAVECYVFWNYHVPTLEMRDTPDYTGRGNVTLFLELAAKADLFVIWRIGPYVCAEWPGGGYPDWFKQIGAHGRSATQPYMNETYKWMHQHIEHVRPFFATNGGPIIMTQNENELSGANPAYLDFLYTLEVELKTGLPWIMCHGAHTNNSIETCNGCDCSGYVEQLAAQDQPAMWSEDEQWFDRFSQGASVRKTSDVGKGVAAFVATGGSMHNFYMFHGGTMWGNWSTTVRRTRLTPSYANSANLASDSIIYDPKYSTIAALHHILVEYSPTILGTPIGPVPNAKGVWNVTMSGNRGDPPLTFTFNEGTTAVQVESGEAVHTMEPDSAMIFDGAGTRLWYSEPGAIDGVGQPYLPAPGAADLKWTSWTDGGLGGPADSSAAADPGQAAAAAGTWYRTTFPRPTLPTGAQMSINMTGFGQGNLFLNGVHVVYFNLQFGECFRPPGGVNFHGACLGYVKERCDKPTQDCYHVPPEWIADENEMLIFSQAKLPPNVTSINPELLSVVYRVDPPQYRHILAGLETDGGREDVLGE
jgi:hypothetical protein